MQQHGSKFFARSLPPLRRPKFIFFGTWVILHIKGNRKCSNAIWYQMQTEVQLIRNLLNLTFDQRSVPDPWVHLGDGSKAKIQLFQNMVMLHIKMAIAHAATY